MRMTLLRTSTILAGCLALSAPAQAETLREALAKAYRANPTLTAARAGQRANDENVPLQRSAGLPSAQVQGEYSEYARRPSIGVERRSASVTGNVSVPLYSGGTVRNSVNAAKLRVEAGQQDLRGTEAAVFSRVVAAYLDVIRDGEIVIFNQDNVRALEVNLQASRDRFEVGDLTRTDVAQSESRLALARADLQGAEAQLIASRENYIALVGNAPENLESPPPLPGLPELVDDAVNTALRDNPDILAAGKDREAARYDVKAAKGQAAPRLSAFAQGAYVDYLNSEPTVPVGAAGSIDQVAVGATLTIPIYQGGRPGALARQAGARESQAIETQVAVERDVIAQTRSAYASWRASQRNIESTRLAVSSANLSLEGVRAENSVGTRTILDILDAQQEVLRARVQYVTAQRDAYVAGFSLLAAMGHAEADDLGLEAGPLYDPNVNYKRVRGKWIDWDFDPAAKAEATRTVDSPAQTAIVPAASAR